MKPNVLFAAKSLQSCPTLCEPMDGNPPGSPVPGILQPRTLEWIAISFSNAWKWKVKVKSLSHIRPSATPWTAAYQAPPSMGFSRQEYWSGVPLPSPVLFTGIIKNKFGLHFNQNKLNTSYKDTAAYFWLVSNLVFPYTPLWKHSLGFHSKSGGLSNQLHYFEKGKEKKKKSV